MNLIRGNPGAQDALHHVGEVRGMLRQIERLAGRMRGATRAEWREWINATRRELDALLRSRQ
jgi:hypothetical protein